MTTEKGIEMKISISEVKRRLHPGVKFIGEFIGINRSICKSGLEITNREVVKNTSSQMISKYVNGPRVGSFIYLTWNGLTAEEKEGSIYLTMTDNDKPEEFLKITLG